MSATPASPDPAVARDALAGLFDPRSAPQALPRAVPADLAAGFAAGGRFDLLRAADGTVLRYAHWPAHTGAARARMVVLGGRGEFIEKYASETIGELLGRGMEVFALDWRGQGLSQRSLPEREKGHVADFALYRDDLHRFLVTVVGPSSGERPVVVLAHSMGGLATLSLLAQGAAPGLIDRAVLCAPMTGLRHATAIRAMLLLAPRASRRTTSFAMGGGTFAGHRLPFAINRVTHDERRYAFTEQWFAAEPRLRLGGPTYGWLRAGLREIGHVMRRDVLARIATPLLVLSPQLDQLIEPRSHRALALHCAQCEVKRYAEAKHEIMMETDDIRARFWRDFDAFVPGRRAEGQPSDRTI